MLNIGNFSYSKIYGTIYFLFIFVIFCIIAVWCYCYNKYVEKVEGIVEDKSLRIHALLELNKKYDFYYLLEYNDIPSKELSSKSQYDRFIMNGYNSYLLEYISKNKDYLIEILRKAGLNRTKFDLYNQAILHLPPESPPIIAKENGVSYSLFNEIETKLFEQYKLKPVINPVWLLRSTYTSPGGRNHYENNKEFNIADMQRKIVAADNQKKNEDVRIQERNKMSQSLRYDIMKRDGFKCVLCGRNTSDGVKLHIDHIVPVSKGGKTVKSNLRTLCEDCNLGKRDKYDENGIN